MSVPSLKAILFSTTFGGEHSSRRGRHLDPSWQEWLEGLEIVLEEGDTSHLSGILPDQAALYGVLARIDHLSLTLLSLERSETHVPGKELL